MQDCTSLDQCKIFSPETMKANKANPLWEFTMHSTNTMTQGIKGIEAIKNNSSFQPSNAALKVHDNEHELTTNLSSQTGVLTFF